MAKMKSSREWILFKEHKCLYINADSKWRKEVSTSIVFRLNRWTNASSITTNKYRKLYYTSYTYFRSLNKYYSLLSSTLSETLSTRHSEKYSFPPRMQGLREPSANFHQNKYFVTTVTIFSNINPEIFMIMK